MWKIAGATIYFGNAERPVYIPLLHLFLQSAVAGHPANVGTQLFGFGSDWPTNATNIQEMKI